MTTKIEIIKVLQKIAQNEHVEFAEFREKLTKYCKKNEDAVFDLFRHLRGIEQELSDFINGRIKISVERSVIIKVLKTVRTEIEIVRCRMKHPGYFIHKPTKPPVLSKPPDPAGKWTKNKIDLIVLIYALKNSVDYGEVTYKALQECFEYIFQIKLGNISKRVVEAYGRKNQSKTGYFESLIEDFNQICDKLGE